MKEHRIYLDDVRTPIDSTWIVVRNYDEFVKKVEELGLETIATISQLGRMEPAQQAYEPMFKYLNNLFND